MPYLAALQISTEHPGPTVYWQKDRLAHCDAQERGNLSQRLMTHEREIRLTDAGECCINVNEPWTLGRSFVLL
jgi:hypothetical protein